MTPNPTTRTPILHVAVQRSLYALTRFISYAGIAGLAAFVSLAGLAAAAAEQYTFEIEENIDRAGSDYANFIPQNNDLYACVEACRGNAKCTAFSYVKPGVQEPAARCWLKEKTSVKTPNNCCISGVKSVSEIAIERPSSATSGLDYPGNDYRRIVLDTPEASACEHECRLDSKCKAYSFVKVGAQGPAAICYLKSTAANATPASCCTAGVKSFDPTSLDDVSLEANQNRPGGDYKNFDLATPDPLLCAAACKTDKACRAYTFVNPGVQGPKAKCWLKNIPAGSLPNFDACCVSGVKTPDTGVKSALTRGQIIAGTASQSQCKAGVVDDVFDALCVAGNGFGLSCKNRNTPMCSSYVRQLPLGVEAQTKPMAGVLNALKTSAYEGFGGRGKYLSDAALCAFRELSPQFSLVNGGKGGPVFSGNDPKSKNVFGDFSYGQTIGYLDFDLAAKRFKGYRRLGFCMPIVGCFDSVAQDFTVEFENFPVSPPIYVATSPASAEGQPSTRATYTEFNKLHALKLSTEKTADASKSSTSWIGGKNVELWPPKITVATPAGPVSVQPKFKYHSEETVIGAPHQNVSLYQRTAESAPAWPHPSALEDIYGADYGIAYPLLAASRGEGWQSAIALGNRDPSLGRSTWSPSGAPPARPDRDLTTARSGAERNPSTEASAGGRLSYPDAGELSKYIPSWMPLNNLTFEIWVEPEARAAVSGQFDIIAAEAFIPPNVPDTKDLPWSGADLSMLANASGSFGLVLNAGLHMVLEIPFPFGSPLTIIDVHPHWTKVLGEGNSFMPAKNAYFASQYSPGITPTPYAHFKTFKANLGAPSGAQADKYVAACLAENKKTPPEAPPPPTAKPGDGSKLFDNDYIEVPCNICAYADKQALTGDKQVDDILKQYGLDKKFHEATLLPVARPAGAREWSCDQPMKSGCHDFCRLHATTGPNAKTAPMTYLHGPDASLKIKNKGETYSGKDCHFIAPR